MSKEEIFKQFIYTLEDDIKNKTFLTYEEENEWKDYLERIINSQTNKYKFILDKIKEWKKQTLFDLNRQYKTFEYWEELFEDLDKILEEI